MSKKHSTDIRTFFAKPSASTIPATSSQTPSKLYENVEQSGHSDPGPPTSRVLFSDLGDLHSGPSRPVLKNYPYSDFSGKKNVVLHLCI